MRKRKLCYRIPGTKTISSLPADPIRHASSRVSSRNPDRLSIVLRLLICLPTATFELELVNITREDSKTANLSQLQSNVRRRGYDEGGHG